MTQGENNDPLRKTLVISRERWLSMGFSPQQFRTLVAAGELTKVRNGAYATKRAVAWAHDDPGRTHMMHVYAAMDRRGSAVASHETAAVIHGIDLFRQPGDTISLTLPPGSRPGKKAGVIVHAAALPASQVITLHKVRVTSLARTVADLARTLPFMEAVVVADSALRSDRVGEAEILAVLRKCGQWPGVRQAKRVVEFANPNAESVLESCGRVFLHERGLGAPHVGATITGPDYRYAVDLYYPQHKTIVEFDGMRKYSEDQVRRKQFEGDRVLRDAGYKVVHVTWQELFGSTDDVAERIRTAFAASSPV